MDSAVIAPGGDPPTLVVSVLGGGRASSQRAGLSGQPGRPRALMIPAILRDPVADET
jgi:hypothetical protein